MCSAHRLTKRNIWEKFNENCQKSSGDMERSPNSRVNPFTFSLGSRAMCYAHHLTERNLWVKFNEIAKRAQEIWN